MAIYKQFNTNEVVISPFKANKRFRFENNQVSSSDVCIEYYQSQQGTYLSGSFDTGFNTMQDGVTVFSSIKQLYYSNYLTSSWGDTLSTASLVPGPTGPQGQNLGFDTYVGNITGPRFENFLQSSLTQDRKFAQFSASAAPIGFAGTNTGVSQSIDANYISSINTLNIIFGSTVESTTAGAITAGDTITYGSPVGVNKVGDTVTSTTVGVTIPAGTKIETTNGTTELTLDQDVTLVNPSTLYIAGDPDLSSVGIDETYVLSTATWNGAIGNSPFNLTIAPLLVGAVVSATGTTITSATNNTTVDAYDVDTYFTTAGGGTGASIRITAAGAVVTEITVVAPGIGYTTSSIITITAAQLNALGSNLGVVMAGGDATFAIALSDLDDLTLIVNASQLVEERINPDVDGALRGLTLKSNDIYNFIAAGAAGTIALTYLQAPKGPSVISIPSMLFGEAIQPSSFQFEYTSSINFSRSIVDDDGQGNLIVTQSNSSGNEIFSGSVGQIFYSQGIAVITGPDSGSLREFAHNVGYKDNMNPNIMSSSLSYSSSITIDENQYKCSVRDSEFLSTTNPSALGVSGQLSQTSNQLFGSWNPGSISGLPASTTQSPVIPYNRTGDKNSSTYYVFKSGTSTTIGPQYKVELQSAGGTSLEFIGVAVDAETGNGARNSLGQSQFNSTGSAAGIAQGFCTAINSVNGFNSEISASLFTTAVTNDSVHLIQSQPGSVGNTPIKYSDSFNLLLNNSNKPTPIRGQVRFGNTQQSQTAYNIDGTDTYGGSKGAKLSFTIDGSSGVDSINVYTDPTTSEIFTGRGYNTGDILEIRAGDLGGTGTGSITLSINDINYESGGQIYHDFVTGSYFSPYVTTVGLYNKSNELVVVGKFPRPLPISLQTDTTYIINFDTN